MAQSLKHAMRSDTCGRNRLRLQALEHAICRKKSLPACSAAATASNAPNCGWNCWTRNWCLQRGYAWLARPGRPAHHRCTNDPYWPAGARYPCGWTGRFDGLSTPVDLVFTMPLECQRTSHQQPRGKSWNTRSHRSRMRLTHWPRTTARKPLSTTMASTTMPMW